MTDSVQKTDAKDLFKIKLHVSLIISHVFLIKFKTQIKHGNLLNNSLTIRVDLKMKMTHVDTMDLLFNSDINPVCFKY